MADSPSELHFEIEKLERKHAEYPEGRFFVPLANAYRKMGDVETAEALLRAGVERHPDYLSAHIVLGRCLADRGATGEAAEEFRFVLSQDPQNLIALRTLGELAAADGRAGEAADWYRELLAVDPMNEDARQALDALGDAPASPDLENEFRSGAGWWEPVPQDDATGSAGAAPPVPEDAASLADEPSASEITLTEAGANAGGMDTWSGYDDLPGLRPGAEQVGQDEEDEEEPAYEIDDRSSEVVTETIAELYARQGLVERAATVYRELIRRRGGDAALEQRLAELEGQAAAQRDAGSESAVGSEGFESTQTSEAADPFASSFADGFGGEEPAFGSSLEEFTPELEDDSTFGFIHDGFVTEEDNADGFTVADAPQAATEWTGGATLSGGESPTEYGNEAISAAPGAGGPSSPAAPTIVHFLAELAAWRPGSGGATQDLVEERGPESAAAESVAVAAEPEPAADAGSLPFLEEVTDGDAFSGTGSAEEEPFPWELPGDDFETSPEPVADAHASEIDAFFSEDVEVDPEPEVQPAAERPTEPVSAPDPIEARGTAATESAGSQEDDDLESFQAWLRSLKR